MCNVCAYTAVAGVSGLRVWLQMRGWAWLTRRRLRAITVAVALIALALVTVSFGG